MGDVEPCESHGSRRADQKKSDGRHLLLPETHHQPAREEARSVHGENVPLNAESRLIHRVSVTDHGDRRRGHHEGHKAVGDDAYRDGKQVARRRENAEERPGAVRSRGTRIRT